MGGMVACCRPSSEEKYDVTPKEKVEVKGSKIKIVHEEENDHGKSRRAGDKDLARTGGGGGARVDEPAVTGVRAGVTKSAPSPPAADRERSNAASAHTPSTTLAKEKSAESSANSGGASATTGRPAGVDLQDRQQEGLSFGYEANKPNADRPAGSTETRLPRPVAASATTERTISTERRTQPSFQIERDPQPTEEDAKPKPATAERTFPAFERKTQPSFQIERSPPAGGFVKAVDEDASSDITPADDMPARPRTQEPTPAASSSTAGATKPRFQIVRDYS